MAAAELLPPSTCSLPATGTVTRFRESSVDCYQWWADQRWLVPELWRKHLPNGTVNHDNLALKLKTFIQWCTRWVVRGGGEFLAFKMEFVASKQMRVLSGCVPNSERSGLGVKRGSFLKNILYNYLSLTFQNSITIRLLPDFHEKRTLQCTITGLITKKAQIQNTGLGHRLSMKLSSQTKYKQIADPIPRSKMHNDLSKLKRMRHQEACHSAASQNSPCLSLYLSHPALLPAPPLNSSKHTLATCSSKLRDQRSSLPSALCLYLFCELEDCDAMILTLTRHTSVLEQYLLLCLLKGFLVCGIPQKQTILQSSKQYLVQKQ